MVHPMSKLPVPSKLRPPQVNVKRPLAVDEGKDEGAPQPKRSKSEVVAKPTVTVRTNGVKKPTASKPQKPKVVSGPRAVSQVNRAAGGSTRQAAAKPAAAKPAKQIVARNPAPARSTARPRPTNTSTAKPGVTSATNGPKKTSKRPAWDLKGRLADIESQLEVRNVANSQLLQEVTAKRGDNDVLEHSNKQQQAALERADSKILQLERQVRDAEDELASTTRRLQRDNSDLLQTNHQMERQLVDTRGDLAASRQECSGLKQSVAQMTAAQAGITAQLANTKLNYEQSQEAGRRYQAEIAELKAVIAEHQATIADQDSQIRDNETTRRKLHNTIQELKGNIRVFCRVRPLLPDEASSGDEIGHINFAGTDNKSIELTNVDLNESNVGTRSSSSKKFDFAFDRVFDPSSTQAEVFEEISQLVQSALDGYNVCVFAYGQTGSGKTFTMEGPDNVEEQTEGMIPRAVRQIFQTAGQLREKGWEYTMEASFLEIYNETVRDLLGAGDKKCEIKMADAKGTDVEVTNSTTVTVTSEGQVQSLLGRATHNRAVAATNCNERSSRSHSVFRLKLNGSNALTGESSQGTLNLVDLAGSERLSQSGSTGDRLRETKNINRSLSNLGNVIMALANKEHHIPYRNSKLTHLLQNSLGGNSKTLMFVNVSPREENFQESICSLRFATKVNQCNIGTAQKKVK
ncbi:carboxy-terminal kinesin 2-like isoform X2 [Patiria miniata]|nr:carboxy-terminal kinesin 2-like isoform X2 [Patiria miniata]